MPAPELPEAVQPTGDDPQAALPGGCYRLRYLPMGGFKRFDGVLRVEWLDAKGSEPLQLRISGDLYYRDWWRLWERRWIHRKGIPWLHHWGYSYYLRAANGSAIDPAGSVRLKLEMHEFDPTDRSWNLKQVVDASLARSTATSRLEGEVSKDGSPVGRMVAVRVSPFLRKARLEIDRIDGANLPQGPGTVPLTFAKVLETVDWELQMVRRSQTVSKSTPGPWTDADLHAAMLLAKDKPSSKEWRYHLLCVDRFQMEAWGRMYDRGSGGLDYPREGAALAALAPLADSFFPSEIRGEPHHKHPAFYFWHALHELGRMQGLVEYSGNQVMNQLSRLHCEGVPLPDGLAYAYSKYHATILRHAPDPWVRPGGVIPYRPPGSPLRPPVVEVKIKIRLLNSNLPLGAPLRLDLKITNNDRVEIEVPRNVSLKGGYVDGFVEDSSGRVRTFRPMVNHLTFNPYVVLAPGASLEDSLTLLRGPEGALAPEVGDYTVTVRLIWPVGEYRLQLEGTAKLEVSLPPAIKDHLAADRLLRTPNVMLPLVLGVTKPRDGMKAIEKALQAPTLRPHFSGLKARLEAQAGNFERAAGYIDDETILSTVEASRLIDIVQAGAAPSDLGSPAVRKMLKFLEQKSRKGGNP